MLRANSRTGDANAWDVSKDDGPFFCPECKGLVILKQGLVKIEHFAHSAGSNCTFSMGESEEHRYAKREIYRALQTHPLVTKLRLERSLGDVRPDVSFCFKDRHYIAIEVQLSTLSPDELARRTKSYYAKNICVLWTPPYDDAILEGRRYPFLFWVKYLHALYFGRVYFWLSGEVILPIHFMPYELPSGRKRYGEESGMWRAPLSKRYRVPTFLPQAHITEMQESIRGAWQAHYFSLPPARLWCLPRESQQDHGVAESRW